jgi:hypothetical protein
VEHTQRYEVEEMQVRYQFQAVPVRTLVAVLIALVALLGAGALGYNLGQANSAGHAVVATGQSIRQPASHAAGQAQGASPAPAAGQAQACLRCQ